MRTFFVTAAAALLVLTSLAAQPRVLAITRVNVVDVVDGRILPNSTVVIDGTTIASVTPNGKAPSGAQILNGDGKFLIPGLWDMHAHTEGSGDPGCRSMWRTA